MQAVFSEMTQGTSWTSAHGEHHFREHGRKHEYEYWKKDGPEGVNRKLQLRFSPTEEQLISKMKLK